MMVAYFVLKHLDVPHTTIVFSCLVVVCVCVTPLGWPCAACGLKNDARSTVCTVCFAECDPEVEVAAAFKSLVGLFARWRTLLWLPCTCTKQISLHGGLF